jgi:Flp pilus assembly protein TadG
MKRSTTNAGATLVEFSLCFIVFIMLCMAIIDFGRYMLTQHHLNLIVAEAARAGITGTRLDRDIGSGQVVTLDREKSIRVAAIEAANRLTNGAVDLGTVNPYSPKNIVIEHCPAANSYSSQNISELVWLPGPGKYDDLIRITVSTQFAWITPLMKWIGSNTTLSTIKASSLQRNRGDEDKFSTD